MKISFYRFIFSIFLIGFSRGQIYIPADPFYLLEFEKNIINTNGLLSFRPTFTKNNTDSFLLDIKYRSELFYNSNSPNLENMSDRWLGKGGGLFTSFNISFRHKYVMGSFEPFFFVSENNNYEVPKRVPLFSQLSDNNGHHKKSPYQSIGIREFQLYLHKNGLGLGISNANMWWGPGIHSSMVMTNNAPGFAHFSLGTIEEKRFKNFGIVGRYIFSKFDDRNTYEPFFTSIIFGITHYADPIVSAGFTKSALTGGSYERADNLKWHEAALAFLQGVTAGDVETYKERHSYDDHTISAFISTYFPRSRLKFFLEAGRNDIAWDIYNLILAPDHSIATNFGIRKYGMFGSDNIYWGMEYIKLFSGRYLHRLFVGPWYNRDGYEFSSFDGRHFAAHSGPDSDDFFVYFGYKKGNIDIKPSFNFERHGLQEPVILSDSGNHGSTLINYWPETKFEIRIDARYEYQDYNFNLYIENEIVNNLEFKDNTRNGIVIWLGVEKHISTKEVIKTINKIFKN